MTDDIVTRLRMPICGNYDDDHPSWGPQPCDGCVEAADEIERLRAELNVMAEAVLEAKETISRCMTLTSNFLTTRNEGILERLKPYVRAEIIDPDLWALAMKHRTKHTSTTDYAERRGFGNE